MTNIPSELSEGDRVRVTARSVEHSEDITEYHPVNQAVTNTATVVDDSGESTVIQFEETEWKTETDDPTQYTKLVDRNDGEMRCVYLDREYSHSMLTCAVIDDIEIMDANEGA